MLLSEGGMTGDQLVSRVCTQHLYRVSKPSLSLFFAPSLKVFKTRLERAVSNLVWVKVTLPVAWGLELKDLEGPLHRRLIPIL